MPRATGRRSVISKYAVPDEPFDSQVKIVGDLKEKVKKFKLLDLNLTDQVLFPQMNIYFSWSVSLDKMGGRQFVPNPKFINLFNSTIMNLMDFPVFDTTR